MAEETILPILLTISVLTNVILLVGYALFPVVMKLLRRTKSVIIGQGPTHVVIEERRIKGKWFTMKTDGEEGDVHIDDDLTERDAMGRPVIWVDLRTFHQIQPTDDQKEALRKARKSAGKKPAEPKKVTIKEGDQEREIEIHEIRAQLPGFKGECINDDEETTIEGNDGSKKIYKWPVWRRVDGKFLLRRRKDLRWAKMEEESGMWAAIEKIALPALLVMGLVMLILMIIIMSGGGVA